MNNRFHAVEDPHAIACHEAGHLIAHSFRNRRIEKVSLDWIDGMRGCFLQPVAPDWTDFDEMLTLLAGPRAQIDLHPHSIDPLKLDSFRAKIIQPLDEPNVVPRIYDYTAWEHDVTPVYTMLSRPHWPAKGLELFVTVGAVHDEVEARLSKFFADEYAVAATEAITAQLLSVRFLGGGDAEALVESTRVLEQPKLRELMTWN